MAYQDMIVRDRYGVCESNGITDDLHAFREEIDYGRYTPLDDPDLARITRLRLLGGDGMPGYDLSYCWGVLKDGTKVRVTLPRYQFRSGYGLIPDLVRMCKDAGVYGKGLGILDADVISVLR
jgi:hypothetical protein